MAHISVPPGASNHAVRILQLARTIRDGANLALETSDISKAYLNGASGAALDNDATYSLLAAAWGVTNAEAHAIYAALVVTQGNLSGNKISNLIDTIG